MLLVRRTNCSSLPILEDEQTPDIVCQEIKLCSNATCHLFPLPSRPPLEQQKKNEERAKRIREIQQQWRKTGKIKETRWDPWDWIVQLVTQAINSHKPILDIDGDLFSSNKHS
jgi:hypothetical protein